MPPTIIALVNQKGGVAKTTSCISLGAALSQEENHGQRKRVLLLDADPQASMTVALGFQQPDDLPFTLADAMNKVMNDQPLLPSEGIIHHAEGVDLLPSSIALAGTEVSLVNAMSRESTLKQVINIYKKDYDYILIDCMPSLGMLTINALTAADSVIIPVQGQYLAAKGLEQLMRTIARVKRQINPHLTVDGILLTMMDSRTTLAKEISEQLRRNYGSRVFASEIPRSIRVAEISVTGTSIYEHDPEGKAARAYAALTKEVLQLGPQIKRHRADPVR